MSGENKLVLICGALWLITKTVLHNFISLELNVKAGVMLNLFLILLVAVFAIHQKVQSTKGHDYHFLDDLKTVLRATSKYVLFSVICLAIFNYGIAREATLIKKAGSLLSIDELYDIPENYAELQATDFLLENVSAEEAKAKQVERFELFSKWYVQLSLPFFALILAAIIYSLLASMLWRRLMK